MYNFRKERSEVMIIIDVEIRRHGECDDYEKDVLTLRGKEETKELAGGICEPDLVLSSSTNRSIETAKILAEGRKVEISPFLDEIPEIDRGEKFNPKTARRCAEKALRFIYNEILEVNAELLVITSGGLLGAIKLYLKNKCKTLKTENDLPEFKPLKGIRLSIQVETIS